MKTPFSRNSAKPGFKPTVLWWSRSGRDYSRDRILRTAFRFLGWNIDDFTPAVSALGHIEARLRRLRTPDLVWVPCFRQRDAAAAQRWGRSRGVPVVLDPLISAWDKQVFERNKFTADSSAGTRLLKWERRLFQHSDVVVADTQCHADFFENALGVDRSRLAVIPVSAEEEIFVPQRARDQNPPVHVMFYGSFIGLQGPQWIAQAARQSPNIRWTFIGSGPQLNDCQNTLAGCDHVRFIPRVPYSELPRQIGQADILLGVFGTSDKAGRVIPNKVYQSLACGRPVITRRSTAYPQPLREQSPKVSGITWVTAGQSTEIANAVRALAADVESLPNRGAAARRTYDQWFTNRIVQETLRSALSIAMRTEHRAAA